MDEQFKFIQIKNSLFLKNGISQQHSPGLLFYKFLDNSIIIHGFLVVNIHMLPARQSFFDHGGLQVAFNQL